MVANMADALLAGLPRIARVAEEVRLRGLLGMAVAAAAGAWWTIQWLLDQPMDAGRTWLYALVVAVLLGILGAVHVPRRLRDGLRAPRFPSPRVVYETRADGRERRLRLAGAVFLSTIVILMFDRLADLGGITAGVVVGVGGALGVWDLVESRRWAQAERERDAELFVRIGAQSLVASLGAIEIFEVPNRSDDPPDWR